jgi:hypothetical protein
MKINVNKIVLDADIFEILKLAYSIDPEAVKKSFQEHGIALDEENIELIATLHKNGDDVKGILLDSNDNPIYFNVEEILANTTSNFNDKFVEKELDLQW